MRCIPRGMGRSVDRVLTGQPLSHEMYIKLPGADVVLLTEGNIIGCDTASATWTRRGLRPGMSIRSLRGNREISPLTICQCRRRPAPGRRGVIAGDVRRGEVGLAHSSGEAGEQPERSGVSGAKERGQGTRNSHMRRTQSRESMSQRLSRVRGSCEAAEERTVYSIVPPADSRSTGSRIPLPEQESGRRSGWHQVDGLRRKHEEQHNRSAPEATLGQLQGAARQASLHPKSGWKTTPARHRLAGGQDRPVCAGENPERSL